MICIKNYIYKTQMDYMGSSPIYIKENVYMGWSPITQMDKNKNQRSTSHVQQSTRGKFQN